MGVVGAFLGSFVNFFLLLKSLIIDDWDGISQTAGNSIGNSIGWIFMYGFLAFIISVIVFAALLIVLFPLGSFIGWLYGKTSRSMDTNS